MYILDLGHSLLIMGCKVSSIVVQIYVSLEAASCEDSNVVSDFIIGCKIITFFKGSVVQATLVLLISHFTSSICTCIAVDRSGSCCTPQVLLMLETCLCLHYQ